jgi:hypothetical protein
MDSCFLPWYIIASRLFRPRRSERLLLGWTMESRDRGSRVGFCDPLAGADDGRNGEGYRK